MSHERLAAQTRSVQKSPIIPPHEVRSFSNVCFFHENDFYHDSLLPIRKKFLTTSPDLCYELRERLLHPNKLRLSNAYGPVGG